jgi:hypothetical protein
MAVPWIFVNEQFLLLAFVQMAKLGRRHYHQGALLAFLGFAGATNLLHNLLSFGH